MLSFSFTLTLLIVVNCVREPVSQRDPNRVGSDLVAFRRSDAIMYDEEEKGPIFILNVG